MLFLCILIGMLMFFFNKEYILLSLMFIEFMSLNLIYLYMCYYEELGFNYWNLIYMLVFIVCDAVLGLSLLIILIRFYGHNYMSLLFMAC
uniref:NADH dehydrogenase subunit 4L n=1 Tax=Ceraphron sp. MM-2014 TaxID=1502696 RepID=A0A096XL14_9HYME|nr:NADH dehydrogenase subunit 4L [Ceraphron sp. MM-2014]